MRKITILLLGGLFLLLSSRVVAQSSNDNKNHQKISYVDSLNFEFNNTVYYSFYNPSYMATSTPIFTMLKIDIDRKGKVANIEFSDSADSTFVKAYLNRPKWHDDTATIEKYAKAKAYIDISLLIPISWEPDYPNQKKVFSYDELENALRFRKRDFTGRSVILSPIYIRVLSSGN